MATTLYITYPPPPDPDVYTLTAAAGTAYPLVVCGRASTKNNNTIKGATLTPTGGKAINGIVRKQPSSWVVLFPIAAVADTTYTIQITDALGSPPAIGTFQFAAPKKGAKERDLDPGNGATVNGQGFSVSFPNPLIGGVQYSAAADIHQAGGPTTSGTEIVEGPTAVFSFQGIPAGGDYIITGYVYCMPPQDSFSTGITVTNHMGP
jgi:hypothetical protein